MSELDDVSRRIVEDLAELTPDEEVLVVAEEGNTAVARAVADAARDAGATTSLVVTSQLDAHGNEPPAGVAAAMRAVDVCFTATTHAITHTESRIAASDAGTRVVVLRGVTEDLMVEGGMNTDYDRLRERTEAVRDALDAATEVRVTAPAGTDVTFGVEGRPAFVIDGFFHDYGFSALPPGESPVAPAAGTAEGTVVVDYSMDNLGRLDEPVELTFEDGFVTAVEGGEDAARLERLLAESDDNAGNMAEFAFGTNPDARLVGNLAEDKKKLGTVHFAVGDNTSLDGDLGSEIHLDGVVLDPTVELDGRTVLAAGELDREALAAVADRD